MATPPQVQPPYEYPQLQVMAPSSNYGEGPITPRAGQGFFHFDVAQYYRQSQNNDEDEDLEPARHSTWNLHLNFNKKELRYTMVLHFYML